MTSSPDEKKADSAAERRAVVAESDEPAPTPPKSEFDVGQLPILLYAFVAVLLIAATVSLVA